MQNGQPDPGEHNKAIVELLERVLADAKANKFQAFAFVGIGAQNGQLVNGCVGGLSDLFFAVSVLSDAIKMQMINPQPRGGIVPARGAVPPFPGFKK